MVIGALIAVPPLSADMKWISAQKLRSASELELSLVPSYLNPQNSFKYLNSIRAFEESGLTQLAHKYSREALNFNPDSYDLWRALYLIQASSSAEREEAIKNMKRLDPLNPDVTAN
jgi:tetratricopeptide (TPR) repeat protein